MNPEEIRRRVIEEDMNFFYKHPVDWFFENILFGSTFDQQQRRLTEEERAAAEVRAAQAAAAAAAAETRALREREKEPEEVSYCPYCGSSSCSGDYRCPALDDDD